MIPHVYVQLNMRTGWTCPDLQVQHEVDKLIFSNHTTKNLRSYIGSDIVLLALRVAHKENRMVLHLYDDLGEEIVVDKDGRLSRYPACLDVTSNLLRRII